MPWKINRTIKVTLEELGLPQFWIELDSPINYSQADLEVENEDSAFSFLAKFIVKWNLTDPITDEPLSVPTEANPASLERIPLGVNIFIRDILIDEANNSVKKKTDSESLISTSPQRGEISLDQAGSLFRSSESQLGS